MFPFIVVVIINILPNNREGETSSSNRDGQKKYSLVRPFSDNPTTGPFLCPSLVSVVHKKKNLKKKYSRVYMNTQYLGLICVRHAIKIRTIIIVIKRVVIVCTYGFSGSHSSIALNNVAKPSGVFFFFLKDIYLCIHNIRTRKLQGISPEYCFSGASSMSPPPQYHFIFNFFVALSAKKPII